MPWRGIWIYWTGGGPSPCSPPHDGEFARLTGTALPIQNRLEAARTFAKEHRCILVLKGHRTVTAAPDGRAWINTTGNPGIAKGGSGDVLAGLIASFLGQRQLERWCGGPAELVAAAVYFHGLAGDRAAERLGEYSMTPRRPARLPAGGAEGAGAVKRRRVREEA